MAYDLMSSSRCMIDWLFVGTSTQSSNLDACMMNMSESLTTFGVSAYCDLKALLEYPCLCQVEHYGVGLLHPLLVSIQVQCLGSRGSKMGKWESVKCEGRKCTWRGVNKQ